METLDHHGREIAVREVARPDGWSCRVLLAEDGSAYLEYLVSVGPYKIDRVVVHRLARQDYAAFAAGALDLGVLARNLAEHDHEYRVFERRG
jgi:hypothetical protein